MITGVNAGQMFALEGSQVVIGRGRDAQIRVDDVGISRSHVRINRALDGQFVVQDLGSTNGTFVAGNRVKEAFLKDGDHLQVGPNVVFKFALVDEAEESLAKRLYESSTRDALTRAFNRKYFFERLMSEVAYAARHRTKLSVILFDLDKFKNLNDSFGHLAGDEALRRVSAQVLALIRAEDVFARYGGEEFVILVRGIDSANVVLFAERVRRSVEKLVIPWNPNPVTVTISAGVASISECWNREVASSKKEHAFGEAMLLLADERLYRAKSLGRNRVCSDS